MTRVPLPLYCKYSEMDGLHRPMKRRPRPFDWAPWFAVVLTVAVAALMYGFAVLRFGL